MILRSSSLPLGDDERSTDDVWRAGDDVPLLLQILCPLLEPSGEFLGRPAGVLGLHARLLSGLHIHVELESPV